MKKSYKNFACVITFVLLLVFLCACDKSTKNTKVDIYESETDRKILSMVNNEVNADDVISTTYSPDVLMDLPCGNYAENELFEKTPPECVRLSEDGKYAYFVYKSDDGHYAFIFYSFEYNTFPIIFQPYLGQCVSSIDFDNLEIGRTTLSEIMDMDPYGDYISLHLGLVPKEYMTRHYTSDGYMVTVYYGKEGTISKIEKKKIDELINEHGGLLLGDLLEKDKKLLMP